MINYKNVRTGNVACVWSRVSTKYQEDNGGSLATQKKICEEYASQHGYLIKAYYGGQHESAKTPGPLVQAMMKAVKKDKSISLIIISEFDRFSREAWQAIRMLQELRELGVVVVGAKYGLDTRTKEGMMMAQNTLAMAQWDNQNRTDKFVGGRADCIRAGAWVEKAPLGYQKVGKSRDAWCYLNDEGKVIRNAFRWKLQGYSNAEILGRLSALGVHITKQALHKILVNPFYAGKIVHRYNNNEMIDGQIEAAVSYSDFLKVQDVLSGRTGRYTHREEKPEFPLLRTVFCYEDQTAFTSYTRTKVTSVQEHKFTYYKCNKPGCRTNVSAKEMHEKFEELLEQYDISKDELELFEDVLRDILKGYSSEAESQSTLLKKRLTEVEKDIKGIRIKFATDKIDKETFQIALQELQERKDLILLELEKWQGDLSNLESLVPVVITTASNIKSYWHTNDLDTKRKVQKLVFPEGVFWDKEIRNYRTSKENKIFEIMRSIPAYYKKEKRTASFKAVPLCG